MGAAFERDYHRKIRESGSAEGGMMGRIPHGIKLGLDRYKKTYVERKSPCSLFRQEHEEKLERLEAILADDTLDRAFQVIDLALKNEPESQQEAAGFEFCILIIFRGGALPKEAAGQRKKRRMAIADKIRELNLLIREEMRQGEGYQDKTLNYSVLASTVESLEQIRQAIKKDPAPLFQKVSAHLPQRITGGASNNLFFGELADWFWRWTGEDHPGHVRSIFKACLMLDRDWAEEDEGCEEEELYEIEDEDLRDDMQAERDKVIEKETKRLAESARKYQHNNRPKE
jgi:hypothetical protein